MEQNPLVHHLRGCGGLGPFGISRPPSGRARASSHPVQRREYKSYPSIGPNRRWFQSCSTFYAPSGGPYHAKALVEQFSCNRSRSQPRTGVLYYRRRFGDGVFCLANDRRRPVCRGKISCRNLGELPTRRAGLTRRFGGRRQRRRHSRK
ncbi:hypothetical protein ES703_84637 [subsurface metagenome]